MSDTVSSESVAADQLRAFIERIERMEEEKKAIADDIKEIYSEAKGNGFDVPVLRQIIRIRKQDHAERMEQEVLLHLYMAALGMQAAPRDDDDGDDDPRPRGRQQGDNRRPAALDMGRASSVAKTETDRLSGEHGGQTNQESAPAVRGFSDVVTPSSGESVIGREEGENSLPATNSNTPGGSGTAREAPGSSAPSNGIAGLREGPEAAPRTNSPVAVEGQRSTPVVDVGGDGGALTPDDSGDTVEPDSERLDDLAAQDGRKMSSDRKPSLGLCSDGVNADPHQGMTGGESAATSWVSHSASDGVPRPEAECRAEPRPAPIHEHDPASAPLGAPNSDMARLKTADEIADEMHLPIEPHELCLQQEKCGRFSHLGLCQICRVAAGLEAPKVAA